MSLILFTPVLTTMATVADTIAQGVQRKRAEAALHPPTLEQAGIGDAIRDLVTVGNLSFSLGTQNYVTAKRCTGFAGFKIESVP
jgi:hypothetical protein